MAWKGRPRTVDVDFTALLPQLIASKLQTENPALYDTLKGLIEKNQQNKQQVNQILQTFIGDIVINDDVDLSAILAAIANLNNLINTGTFITSTDETANFPASRLLVAGTNVTLDLTNPGQIIINTTGGGSGISYIPLATGTEPLTFMSDGLGQPFLIPFIP